VFPRGCINTHGLRKASPSDLYVHRCFFHSKVMKPSTDTQKQIPLHKEEDRISCANSVCLIICCRLMGTKASER
jgi:hypothetical protein